MSVGGLVVSLNLWLLQAASTSSVTCELANGQRLFRSFVLELFIHARVCFHMGEAHEAVQPQNMFTDTASGRKPTPYTFYHGILSPDISHVDCVLVVKWRSSKDQAGGNM